MTPILCFWLSPHDCDAVTYAVHCTDVPDGAGNELLVHQPSSRSKYEEQCVANAVNKRMQSKSPHLSMVVLALISVLNVDDHSTLP